MNLLLFIPQGYNKLLLNDWCYVNDASVLININNKRAI